MNTNLENRVAQLEKSARRWKFAALACAGVIATGLLMGQIRIGGGAGGGINAPAITCDKVTFKTLTLRNADNVERASIALDATDHVVFSLKDKNGVNTLELRSDAEGVADMRVLTSKGKTIATLGSDGNDKGTLSLKDADGKKLFSAP